MLSFHKALCCSESAEGQNHLGELKLGPCLERRACAWLVKAMLVPSHKLMHYSGLKEACLAAQEVTDPCMDPMAVKCPPSDLLPAQHLTSWFASAQCHYEQLVESVLRQHNQCHHQPEPTEEDVSKLAVAFKTDCQPANFAPACCR